MEKGDTGGLWLRVLPAQPPPLPPPSEHRHLRASPFACTKTQAGLSIIGNRVSTGGCSLAMTRALGDTK